MIEASHRWFNRQSYFKDTQIKHMTRAQFSKVTSSHSGSWSIEQKSFIAVRVIIREDYRLMLMRRRAKKKRADTRHLVIIMHRNTLICVRREERSSSVLSHRHSHLFGEERKKERGRKVRTRE